MAGIATSSSVGSLLSGAESLRGEAGVLFEVLAEEALVGEVELQGYLLHAFAGVEQQLAGVGDHHLHYPLRGRVPRHLLHDGGEVARRETLLPGIVANLALTFVVLHQREHEALEHLVLPALRLGLEVLVEEVVRQQFVEEGLREAEYLLVEYGSHGTVFADADHLLLAVLQHGRHLADALSLLRGEAEAGTLAQHHDVHGGESLLGEGQHYVQRALHHEPFHVVALFQQADEGGGRVDVNVPLVDAVRVFVQHHLGVSLLAEEETAHVNERTQYAALQDAFLQVVHRDALKGCFLFSHGCEVSHFLSLDKEKST